MKTYNYYFDKQPITKNQFLASVPKNWENDINNYGEYSYGYYRAVELD